MLMDDLAERSGDKSSLTGHAAPKRRSTLCPLLIYTNWIACLNHFFLLKRMRLVRLNFFLKPQAFIRRA